MLSSWLLSQWPLTFPLHIQQLQGWPTLSFRAGCEIAIFRLVDAVMRNWCNETAFSRRALFQMPHFQCILFLEGIHGYIHTASLRAQFWFIAQIQYFYFLIFLWLFTLLLFFYNVDIIRFESEQITILNWPTCAKEQQRRCASRDYTENTEVTEVSIYTFIYKVMCCGSQWICAQAIRRTQMRRKFFSFSFSWSFACIELSP